MMLNPTGLSQPSDLDVSVWRYMDFTKFVALLESQSLHFSRLDTFGDTFEGSWPRKNVEEFKQHESNSRLRGDWASTLRASRRTRKLFPQCVLVNCWHVNPHESAAMWNLYLKSDEGIAVRSTYRRLGNSLDLSGLSESVYIAPICYIDYEKEHIPKTQLANACFYKRMSFQHEQEARLAIIREPQHSYLRDFDTAPFPEDGMGFRADLESLVSEVVLSPYAARWFYDLVDSVVSRFGYSFTVVASSLMDRPIF